LTRWYNKRVDRPGTLWAERFKSTLVENSVEAILRVACYIDLNSVRAGQTTDPAQYRFSGYGAAVRGDRRAREGLMRILGVSDWAEAARMYRQMLYSRAARANESGKVVLDEKQIREVMDRGGELGLGDILLYRIRYFTDGVAFGSREFVEGVFRKFRGRFGPKRKTGARRIRGIGLGDFYTLRDLRVNAIQ